MRVSTGLLLVFCLGCQVGDGGTSLTTSQTDQTSATTVATDGTAGTTTVGTMTTAGSTGDQTAPSEGEWTFMAGDILTDTCMIGSTPTIGSGIFILTNTGVGTFELAVSGYPTLQCTLTGMDFDCPPLEVIALPVADVVDPMFMDGTVPISVGVAGTFDDWDTITGIQTLVGDCTGTDCGAAADFLGTTWPCMVTGEYSATSPFA